MYYGWIKTDRKPSPPTDSEKKFNFWANIVVLLICSFIALFFYFVIIDGEIEGYTVAEFESVRLSETSKGERSYYITYNFFGTPMKEQISGAEYANINKNQPEYVLVGLYKTTFDFGDKIRLGLPNDGGYSVEKYEKLVAEEVKVIEEYKKHE